MSEEIIEILDLNETDEIIAEENAPEFATIGAVYADGVTLIFDGQEEATDKHYKVNSSVAFKAGQRVKITKEYGTYVVEYPVDDPKADFSGIPTGGTTGQVLTKNSSTNYDVKWATISGDIPTGGTTGQALVKKSNTNYDVQWASAVLPTGGTSGQALLKNASTDYSVAWTTINQVPTGGTTGNVLTKTSSGYAWDSIAGAIPTGGTSGQALVKNSVTNYDVKWATINEVPSTGTTGYVLTKTASGYGWAASTGVPTTGTTNYVLTKTASGFGWDAPSQLITTYGSSTRTITFTGTSSGATLTPSSTNIVLGAYNAYFASIYCNRLYLCYSTGSTANGYLSRASGGQLQWNGTNIT